MSAQAGVWNFNGCPVNQGFLAKLCAGIDHFGPDGGNNHIDGSIGIAYRAFHTTLESRIERQPFVSDHGNVITWDGRLDNRDELIPQLWEGLTGDQTDVAIFSAAFESWGTDSFRRLVGDWAVSVWKPLERELILAVDYMAIRHIFYHVKNDRLWWSTDLAPLVLLSGEKFEIEDDYIAGYLAHDADAHLTPYRGILAVPPGKFVRLRDAGIVSVLRYWSLNPKSRIRYKTDAEYEEHFRIAFRQAVRRRLRADRPVLAELSGGLDSSSIVCVADDILTKEGAQTSRVDTLSYYDKTEPKGDDWIYFQQIEQKRGRVGLHIDASTFGDPACLQFSEFHALPGYLGAERTLRGERAKAVQNGGYRVVLSGVGGDEFTGGAPKPHAHLADLILQFKWITLVRQLTAWSLVKRRPLAHLLLDASMELLPSFVSQYFDRRAKVERWVQKDFAKRTNFAVRLVGSRVNSGFALPTRRLYIAVVNLMATSMAHQVPPRLALEEIRYPYLDRSFIEFIVSIPADQLLRPGERRSLMRRSLNGIVPSEILSRRSKATAARTPTIALDRNSQELQEAFTSAVSAQRGYINKIRFLEFLASARDGKPVYIQRLLRVVSLEFWLRDLMARSLIDRETTSPTLPRAQSLSATG